MVTHGFYDFLNWFDERAWYPLGRIVGGTVSTFQRALKLANVDLGCSNVMASPSLFLLFFRQLVYLRMQLLDRGHHPYISTGFGRKHFTPLF